MDTTHLRPGDTVTRLLAGQIPMRMVVLRVVGDVLYCAPAQMTPKVAVRQNLIWTFDRSTGVEIDGFLGWGPAFGISGSFLVGNDDPRVRR
jgi:hypothetical protein